MYSDAKSQHREFRKKIKFGVEDDEFILGNIYCNDLWFIKERTYHVQLSESLVQMWVKDEDLTYTRSQLKL